MYCDILRGWGDGSVGSVCCGSSPEHPKLDLVALYPQRCGEGGNPLCWPASLADSVGSRFSEGPVSEKVENSQHRLLAYTAVSLFLLLRGKGLLPLTVYSPGTRRSPGSSLGARTKAEDLEEICWLPCSIVGCSASLLLSSRTICPGMVPPTSIVSQQNALQAPIGQFYAGIFSTMSPFPQTTSLCQLDKI